MRPNPKKNMASMGPYAGVDYNLTLCLIVHSRVDSNTFTMGIPMPESTLTLSQSRSYPYARVDFIPQSGIWPRISLDGFLFTWPAELCERYLWITSPSVIWIPAASDPPLASWTGVQRVLLLHVLLAAAIRRSHLPRCYTEDRSPRHGYVFKIILTLSSLY